MEDIDRLFYSNSEEEFRKLGQELIISWEKKYPTFAKYFVKVWFGSKTQQPRCCYTEYMNNVLIFLYRFLPVYWAEWAHILSGNDMTNNIAEGFMHVFKDFVSAMNQGFF